MPYPVLEFDPAPEAFIEPSRIITARDMPEKVIACFFHEVVKKVAQERHARTIVKNVWEDGPHPLYEIEYKGQRLAFFQPGIGAPMAASLLEEVIAFGGRTFVTCGGAGVLEKEIALGHLMVVDSAVRDEGTSYQYLPAAREIQAQAEMVSVLESTLSGRGLPFITGKTWTTSAPYRETAVRIARRKKEGCLMVEMEASAMMAVAEFRKVRFGQILYGGDNLGGEVWDQRAWERAADVRENLFWLCADILAAFD
jgi:uridine phosphorylase